MGLDVLRASPFHPWTRPTRRCGRTDGRREAVKLASREITDWAFEPSQFQPLLPLRCLSPLCVLCLRGAPICCLSIWGNRFGILYTIFLNEIWFIHMTSLLISLFFPESFGVTFFQIIRRAICPEHMYAAGCRCRTHWLSDSAVNRPSASRTGPLKSAKSFKRVIRV